MLKVLNIQDFSSFTKSSGNIALPLFEAANINITLLPTSLLSTQTDGWSKVYKKDLTEDAIEIAKVWKEEGISFDIVQIGYLASNTDFVLIKYVLENLLSSKGVVIIDPVLGDNGDFYTEDRALLLDKMKQLISCKDYKKIITPNFTEACFLLGHPYSFEKNLSNEKKEQFVRELSTLTYSKVIITSFPDCSNVYYGDGKILSASYPYYDYSYPGTGDLFASLFTIALIKQNDLEFALKFATEVSTASVSYSKQKGQEYKNGVLIYHAMKRVMEVFS